MKCGKKDSQRSVLHANALASSGASPFRAEVPAAVVAKDDNILVTGYRGETGINLPDIEPLSAEVQCEDALALYRQRETTRRWYSLAVPKENCDEHNRLREDLDLAERRWNEALSYDANVLAAKRALQDAFTALIAHQLTCKTGCRQP